jgi:hypothetical protein
MRKFLQEMILFRKNLWKKRTGLSKAKLSSEDEKPKT